MCCICFYYHKSILAKSEFPARFANPHEQYNNNHNHPNYNTNTNYKHKKPFEVRAFDYNCGTSNINSTRPLNNKTTCNNNCTFSNNNCTFSNNLQLNPDSEVNLQRLNTHGHNRHNGHNGHTHQPYDEHIEVQRANTYSDNYAIRQIEYPIVIENSNNRSSYYEIENPEKIKRSNHISNIGNINRISKLNNKVVDSYQESSAEDSCDYDDYNRSNKRYDSDRRNRNRNRRSQEIVVSNLPELNVVRSIEVPIRRTKSMSKVGKFDKIRRLSGINTNMSMNNNNQIEQVNPRRSVRLSKPHYKY